MVKVTLKRYTSKVLFCGNRINPRGVAEGIVLWHGVVNDFLVDDLLLDTGCSKTIVHRDLVGGEQWLEGKSIIIQYVHGDAIAYTLAAMELEIQWKSVLVNAAVSDTLPRSVLVRTDILQLLELLQTSMTFVCARVPCTNAIAFIFFSNSICFKWLLLIYVFIGRYRR